MSQALTTLARLKDWLGIPESQTASDDIYTRLILRISQKVYSVTSRASFAPHLVSERRRGDFRTSVMLRDWPVLSVVSCSTGGTPIPLAASPQDTGYLIDPWDGYPPGTPQTLDLFGYDTGYGAQAFLVSYNAGYQVTGEAQTITSTAPYAVTASAPFGSWFTDGGVVHATTGVAFTQVTTNPSAGQYAVIGTSPGEYSFAAADKGTSVLITYGYVPGDVEQAVLELAGDRDSYRRRIGIKERSVGGQGLTAYDDNAPSATVLDLLQPFIRVAPI
jgi:hypothetical protein